MSWTFACSLWKLKYVMYKEKPFTSQQLHKKIIQLNSDSMNLLFSVSSQFFELIFGSLIASLSSSSWLKWIFLNFNFSNVAV